MDLKKSKILPKLNIRQKLIFDRLIQYFTPEKIELLLNILNGKSNLGIDYSITDFGPLGTVQRMYLKIKI